MNKERLTRKWADAGLQYEQAQKMVSALHEELESTIAKRRSLAMSFTELKIIGIIIAILLGLILKSTWG